MQVSSLGKGGVYTGGCTGYTATPLDFLNWPKFKLRTHYEAGNTGTRMLSKGQVGQFYSTQ